jgi:hypothetical protein
MTGDRGDGTTGVVTAEIVATVEETAGETGAAGDLSGGHMVVRIAGIIAGTHRSGVRNSFPKC